MKNCKVPADISAKIKVMNQCFNIKRKKLLEHLSKFSKADVYKHVLKKRCSENMRQIYRRTLMLKRDFNKAAL